jgi:hypothetical protein
MATRSDVFTTCKLKDFLLIKYEFNFITTLRLHYASWTFLANISDKMV